MNLLPILIGKSSGVLGIDQGDLLFGQEQGRGGKK